MNGHDSFEEKLKQQPLRPVPATWRNEILAVAREVDSQTAADTQEQRDVLPSRAWSFLRNLLWPHPIAWGGLAATWLVIIGLNAASSDPAGAEVAHVTSPPSSEQRQLLHEQEQLLAELIGQAEKAAAAEPKRRSAQPRSAALPRFLNV